LIFLHRRI